MKSKVAGSCLCGQVRFEAALGPDNWMEHCHCSMCRKAHGAASVTWIDLPVGDFRWTAGESELVRYRSSKDWTRIFCRHCGSHVAGQREGAPMLSIAAGVLDGDPGCRPQAHIYVGSKAPWTELLPQFEANRPK